VSSQDSDRVLVFELDTQTTRRVKRADIQGQKQDSKGISEGLGFSVLLNSLRIVPVKVGMNQRWINVWVGDEGSNEVRTQVASVKVPLIVVVQRWFGSYKQLLVVTAAR
jgi:hypothetical protein